MREPIKLTEKEIKEKYPTDAELWEAVDEAVDDGAIYFILFEDGTIYAINSSNMIYNQPIYEF